MNDNVWSVSELTRQIKDLLDGESSLQHIYVRGELSNYKIYPSGHHYFTIKDEEATLKAVMFRREASRLRFRPESGMKVIALGRITVYPRDGVYQLYATELVPDGVGDLHAAFEQLKAKLAEEGLFDRDHKKPLPPYPERIAVITSSAGAAVRDVIRVATKRYPVAKLIVMPVRVQGAEAPPEIVSAIRYANRWKVADLIITGRGGGSIEDLWAFNDERVARAIYESEIPIISAVGHEPDVTIADYVADLRAATPSNGAELATPDQMELRTVLGACETRMAQSLTKKLKLARQQLDLRKQSKVLQSPTRYLEDRRQDLDQLSGRMARAMSQRILTERAALNGKADLLPKAWAASKARRSRELGTLAARLDAMSPLKVLSRGYSITETDQGAAVTTASQLHPGDHITIRFSQGRASAQVEDIQEEAAWQENP